MGKPMKNYECTLECGETCKLRSLKGTCIGLLSAAVRTGVDGKQTCAFYKNKWGEGK